MSSNETEKEIEYKFKIDGLPTQFIVGHNILPKLGSYIEEILKDSPPGKIALVTSEKIKYIILSNFGSNLIKFLPADLGKEAFFLEEGETNKNLSTVEKLCEEFSRKGITRNDLIISVGGGLISDIVGFAASIYHRKVSVAHIPTTFLAQVDASIGGKTGVNLQTGKNLVGTFHQPLFVLSDIRTLKTITKGERWDGTAEVLKYGFILENIDIPVPEGLPDNVRKEIEEPENKKYISRIPNMRNIWESRRDPEDPPLEDYERYIERILQSIVTKGAIVAQDKEDRRGLRALLNYGHTLGHALEVFSHFNLSHGEAVAIGLVYAAELAYVLERISRQSADEYWEVVDCNDVPLGVNKKYIRENEEELIGLMYRDKKASSAINFVLEGKDPKDKINENESEKRGMDPKVPVGEEHIREALERVVSKF